MFFNEDPEHEARWEARERERLARWYQDRVKVDQAEQKPLPTAAAQPAQPAQHPDDEAVDRFAEAMKQKLAQAREKGRGGWETCPPEELSRMLREHVEKGDPRDVANFCMFLWSLGHGITAPQPAQQPLTDDPCPGCQVGKVCRTPKCGRLKLPTDHPLRTGVKP